MRPAGLALLLLLAAGGTRAVEADPCVVAYTTEAQRLDRELKARHTGDPATDRKHKRHMERQLKVASDQAEKCRAAQRRGALKPEASPR